MPQRLKPYALALGLLLGPLILGPWASATPPCADELTPTPRILVDPRGQKRGVLWNQRTPIVLVDAASDLVEFPTQTKQALESARAVGYMADTDTLLMLTPQGELWAWHLREQRALKLTQIRARHLILTSYLFGAILSVDYDPGAPPLILNPHSGRLMISFDDLMHVAVAPSAQRVDF